MLLQMLIRWKQERGLGHEAILFQLPYRKLHTCFQSLLEVVGL